MTDNDIIKYFFYYRNYERLNHKKLIDIPSNIIDYLNNRFNDSDSLFESIVRIKLNIEHKPICPICGQKIKFNNNVRTPFYKTCSKECGNKLSTINCKQTCINKYGVDNVFKLENIQEKKKLTCKEHYGCEYPMQSSQLSNKIYKSKLKKYGNGNNYKKGQLTKEIKYGHKNYFGFNSIEFKELMMKKYGVDNISKLPQTKENLSKIISSNEIQLKTYLTHKKNNSFNKSNLEDESYILLKEKYTDIKRQYRSEVYPFNCDFYIPSLDLYIECNYHWTHGGKIYEGTEEDNQLLQKWKDKNTQYYNNAINTWTNLDIKKYKIAKQNNLNYKIFWNINELKEFIKGET